MDSIKRIILYVGGLLGIALFYRTIAVPKDFIPKSVMAFEPVNILLSYGINPQTALYTIFLLAGFLLVLILSYFIMKELIQAIESFY